ncbi:YchJ family protein [Shewanella woodyi]|uniref:YchJ family protein n=1 Tax=Shewanella woodyi TaxID=60961 RepID=UPI0009EF39F8|nr:YchJ family metal-binding protein [Shewanella woodyi]
MTTETETLCPCGQNDREHPHLYTDCCAPYHQNIKTAGTPEKLMRSRYAAFVLGEYDYLIQTHHRDYLGDLTVEVLAEHTPQWLSLQVLSTQTKGDVGEVCFQAWYRDGNNIDAIHECSQFVQEANRWFYTQGTQKPAIYPKRNDTCLCNSGRKYKQCCLK